ncbi:helix-turn-helix domain-containing protein [Streptomyces anulatus]|uniref:helix-turn-helix domain-containing protein n=1 Tax=Streptomyces anulatus TaxID=1892 RepID=UPI003797A2CF
MPKGTAAEELAGLVRAPKAREGRSQEALGPRLSVSASTLHRYCSGATVPEEFAVVDRLTLLCGADEEAVGAVVDDGLRLRPKPVRSIRRPEYPFTSAEIVLRKRLRARTQAHPNTEIRS